jgi:hypothetical protein
MKIAFTLDEAAEATGYSRRSIQIAIEQNNLIARYANSKPVIEEDELRRWLKSLPTISPRDKKRVA